MTAGTTHEALRHWVGESVPMRRLREELARLAPLDTTVLLGGETGVGKGMAARLLHALSARRGAWVHADCASLPASLFASELFGHERGAFTGAVTRRAGHFERAAGGTIFLDELGELGRVQQAALLHVLQDRCFERVGGAGPLPMRARVVAATSRDLREEVAAGRFRRELYFRVAVARVEIPPLRERSEDVRPLSRAALARIATRLGLEAPRLGAEALAVLARHDWPGNVRELENALERLVIRCSGERVRAEDLAAVLDVLPEPARPAAGPSPDALASMLAECGGNVSRAARRLGLSRTTLRRRLERLEPHGSSRGEAGRVVGCAPIRPTGDTRATSRGVCEELP